MSKRKDLIAWAGQLLLVAVFLPQAVLKFWQPEGLPTQLNWLYDMEAGFAAFVGVMEFIAVLGLIGPPIVKRMYWATPSAAIGLIIVMVGAVVWHLGRDEQIITNIFIAIVAAAVAWLRRGWLGEVRPEGA